MPETTTEQQLATLLRTLPQAPAAWVAAAREIPRSIRETSNPPDLRASPAATRETRPTAEHKIVP